MRLIETLEVCSRVLLIFVALSYEIRNPNNCQNISNIFSSSFCLWRTDVAKISCTKKFPYNSLGIFWSPCDRSWSPRSIHNSLGGAGDDDSELHGLGGLVHLEEAGEHVHWVDSIVVHLERRDIVENSSQTKLGLSKIVVPLLGQCRTAIVPHKAG